MTTTQIAPTLNVPQSGNGKITTDIQLRVQQIQAEMNDLIKERSEVIHGAWVGRIAQEHLLMLGPGGTGKSFFARTMAGHIDGSVYFEAAFDETTDPSQVFGPPDIKAMVEDGKTRRIPTGMLPEATDAFLDEFFNANGPLLHSTMPALNERVFHNNGHPTGIPLRQCLMGTNKLNADADQAALWDRVHMRYIVNPVSQRSNQIDLVGEAIARMAVVGRGTTTSIAQNKTLVTLDELDVAHKEALGLDVPDTVIDLFFDIREELREGEGKIIVSDRRAVEGMAAVMANAWLRGHEEVKVADLDILASMWWTLQEQQSVARGVILGATNPGEKAALDLLDDLDKLRNEMKSTLGNDLDDTRRAKVGVQMVKDADKLLTEANDHLAKASAAGADVGRINEVIAKGKAFKQEVGKAIFGLSADDQNRAANAGS